MNNIVNFNTNSMKLNSGINNGLVILRPTTTDENTPGHTKSLLPNTASNDTAVNYVITSYNLDVSNIIVGNYKNSNGSNQVIDTDIKFNGNVNIANKTGATASGTGALQIAGGAYIAGNTYIDGILNMSNTIVVNKTTSTAYSNTIVDINGNVAMTRLCINKNGSINTTSVLDVSGNIIQIGGYISQF